MAKRDAIAAALAELDRQIDDLTRAKQALLNARDVAPAAASEKKPRKPRAKRGMPAGVDDEGKF